MKKRRYDFFVMSKTFEVIAAKMKEDEEREDRASSQRKAVFSNVRARRKFSRMRLFH